MRISAPGDVKISSGQIQGIGPRKLGLINCPATLIIADTISQFEAAQDSAGKQGDGQADSEARVVLLQLATATHRAQVVRVGLCGQIKVLRRLLVVVCGR